MGNLIRLTPRHEQVRRVKAPVGNKYIYATDCCCGYRAGWYESLDEAALMMKVHTEAQGGPHVRPGDD